LIPSKPPVADLWLPRIAVSALAIHGVLTSWGAIDLQTKGQTIPDFLPWSGMMATGTLAIVARSDRNRP
jgi:hypothetical protein